MKPLFLLAACAILLGGCYTSRERVVERPVPAAPSKEVVVEKHGTATALRSCSYGGSSYSHDSLSCQSHMQFRCEDGTWDGLNTPC